MKEKPLPKQGARALIKSLGDANARMIQNGKKKAAKTSGKKK